LVAGNRHPYATFQKSIPGMPSKRGQSFADTTLRPFQQRIDAALSGADLPHKLARGAVDTAFDVGLDPWTYIPVGKGAELLMNVPGVRGAVEGVASRTVKPIEEAVTRYSREHPGLPGKFAQALNPQGYLRIAGLDKSADAEFEQATNVAMKTARDRKLAEDAVVKKHADAIRRGEMPGDVAQLFNSDRQPFLKPMKKAGIGAKPDTVAATVPDMRGPWEKALEREGVKLGPGTRPQDIIGALYRHRAPQFKENAVQALKAARILGDNPDPAKFAVLAKDIPKVQAELERLLDAKSQGDSSNILRKLTHLGNQAFLAIPVPHVVNLAGLSYLKHGIPTTVQGLINAVRISAGDKGGKIGEGIAELERMGANAQYAPIYSELGLTGWNQVPGSRAAASLANKPLIWMQRASNHAQEKILNPVEQGLRIAALSAEKKAGGSAAEIGQRLNKTFGTDAPNLATELAGGVGAPFAHFHLQTAPGATLKAAVQNPGRLVNAAIADRDFNDQVNPGNSPKFHLSAPGFSAARMFMQPSEYFTSNLGPLSQLQAPWSPLTAIRKGKPLEALGEVTKPYIPASNAAELLLRLKSGKGAHGEAITSDFLPLLTGGSYSKP
jgi:hypothetical protein